MLFHQIFCNLQTNIVYRIHNGLYLLILSKEQQLHKYMLLYCHIHCIIQTYTP